MKDSCLKLIIACLAALSLSATGYADDLGRLFTSAGERAAIDNYHHDGLSVKNENPRNDATRQLKLSGTITSSNGLREVWLNGKRLDDNLDEEPAEARVLGNGQVQLRTGQGVPGLVLKPGQVLDLDNGRIYESFMVNSPVVEKSKTVE